MYDCQRYSTDYIFFLQVCMYLSAASNKRIAGRLSYSVLLSCRLRPSMLRIAPSLWLLAFPRPSLEQEDS
jgi:hypothetical protein